jgi:hypothetical protein
MRQHIIFVDEVNLHKDNSLRLLIEAIKKQPKNVLFFNPTEFGIYLNFNEIQNNVNEIYVLLEKFDVNLFILNGGFNEIDSINLSHEKIKHIQWSTYLLHFTNHNLLVNLKHTFENKNFEKLFVSYNRRITPHRCLMMDLLKKEELMDYGKISWLNVTNSNYDFKYDFQYWNQSYMKIDDFSDINHPAKVKDILKTNVLFNLITESRDEYMFVTEKTYKSIFLEQCFLCFGEIHQNKILEHIGFKLYDEIFDYDFDSNSDINKRANGIIDNIKKLKDKNYNVLYELIKDKIKYNKEIANQILNKDTFIPNEFIDLYNQSPNEFEYEYYKMTDAFQNIDILIKNSM